MKIVITSGYFNPIHVAHINYLNAAKSIGDYLIVIINNDLQVNLKGSTPFMGAEDRLNIVTNLKAVDYACVSLSKDRTVEIDIKWCLDTWQHTYKSISGLVVQNYFVFANGGDVTEENCREAEFCKKLGIELAFGVGGNTKQESSSNLLSKIRQKIDPEIDL